MEGFNLADLIRVNQLIRGQVDFGGFRSWYYVLPPNQRRSLTYLLCEFAHQAGVNEATWSEALTASGLLASDEVVREVLAAGQSEHPVFRLYDFVGSVPENDLPTVFRLFVFLFGIAEGRVYRSESKEYCNHWWHRDLLDERVVRDLMSNPQYYRTAQKDDDRVKGRAQRGVEHDRIDA